MTNITANKNSAPFFLGITGGIACGKTLIYNYFRKFGVRGISADKICRELTEPGQRSLRAIEEVFGKSVILENGGLNRAYLGTTIFSDSKKREALNHILHPEVEKAILNWTDTVRAVTPPEQLAVIEIPLLFETGAYFWVDGILVVSAREATSLERMSKRDGLSVEECRRRYNSQFPLEEKKKRARWIIENDGTIQEAENLAKKIYLEIIGIKNGNTK